MKKPSILGINGKNNITVDVTINATPLSAVAVTSLIAAWGFLAGSFMAMSVGNHGAAIKLTNAAAVNCVTAIVTGVIGIVEHVDALECEYSIKTL